MEATAWNRGLERLIDPCSDPYVIAHTAADEKALNQGGAHLPKALAYSRYAADYLATGVAKGASLPIMCSVGAARQALQAPGLQPALVLVAPEVALLGGAVWGTAGLLAQGGCAAGCVLGASYHVTAASLHGARRVAGHATRVAVQAVSAAAQATQQAVEAAWNGIRQGLQGA